MASGDALPAAQKQEVLDWPGGHRAVGLLAQSHQVPGQRLGVPQGSQGGIPLTPNRDGGHMEDVGTGGRRVNKDGAAQGLAVAAGGHKGVQALKQRFAGVQEEGLGRVAGPGDGDRLALFGRVCLQHGLEGIERA